jgi:lipoate-protein ligase A
MNLTDLSFSSPEMNLAYDEALLLAAEEGETGETLRFWQSESFFVVLGYSRRMDSDVVVDACVKDKVPVLRRYSGGGTILQGPGCLNYSLILRVEQSGPFATITGTTSTILQHHAGVLRFLSGKKIAIEGESDLTMDGRKFSGNAQRRLARYLLFHGTFLFDFDLKKIERYLSVPGRQPAYRAHRPHGEFLRNIFVAPGSLKKGLIDLWKADAAGALIPLERADRLVRDRYARNDWNQRL